MYSVVAIDPIDQLIRSEFRAPTLGVRIKERRLKNRSVACPEQCCADGVVECGVTFRKRGAGVWTSAHPV